MCYNKPSDYMQRLGSETNNLLAAGLTSPQQLSSLISPIASLQTQYLPNNNRGNNYRYHPYMKPNDLGKTNMSNYSPGAHLSKQSQPPSPSQSPNTIQIPSNKLNKKSAPNSPTSPCNISNSSTPLIQ